MPLGEIELWTRSIVGVREYSEVLKYTIFNLGHGYKDVCFIIKQCMFYTYTFYVSEYVSYFFQS